MELLPSLADFVLHVDRHLAGFIQEYGAWTYGILFLVIFMETGLVVTPFLPGDSLLFATGALAATGALDVYRAYPLLLGAALLGDNVNYAIGSFVGPRAFDGRVRFLKRRHLERTEHFFERYGGKTVVISRFIPIVRTYTPFVAGASRMPYLRFLTYSLVAGVSWMTLFLVGGYFFGNIPVVRENFGLVVIAIILVSVLPAVVELLRHRRAGVRGGAAPGTTRGT
jgi:membrane-associated protein